MNNVKYFICPMSKNIVDSILELESDKIGMAVTRRQIDFNGGYVNNWSTTEFFKYVRNKSEYGKNIIIERDHGGPNQGTFNDDGVASFDDDSQYFEIFHIDPWKKYKKIDDGIRATEESIRAIRKNNPRARFEIGTEQDIKKMSVYDIRRIMCTLIYNLDCYEFDAIDYIVTQSGESIDLMNKTNKGKFNKKRFEEMMAICAFYDKKSKEHNGDFLKNEDYEYRFNNGLFSINIGPELAMIETGIYLDYMTKSEIDQFYEICLLSGKWERWINGDYKNLTKRKLIEICGHYNYGKIGLPPVDDIVRATIKNKLTSLIQIIEK